MGVFTREMLQRSAVQRVKIRRAILLENLAERKRFAAFALIQFFNLGIGIEKGNVQLFRQQPPDGGFAASFHADENNPHACSSTSVKFAPIWIISGMKFSNDFSAICASEMHVSPSTCIAATANDRTMR